MVVCQPLPRLVAETAGLYFIHKPPGLAFHSTDDETGLLPRLRELGSLHEPLLPCHRLDRVTSGLMAVAKSREAASEMALLLRERRVHKYYVALAAGKPKKKQGRVIGDMARSRRGQWMLTRERSNPAVTHFVSAALSEGGGCHAFLLKPATGRTHQLRVALKSLGAPVLGDPRYAASSAGCEARAYLHAAAMRLPGGRPSLTAGGRPCTVLCPPVGEAAGSRFVSAAFSAWWESTFEGAVSEPGGDAFYDSSLVGGLEYHSHARGEVLSSWFAGTPVASRL